MSKPTLPSYPWLIPVTVRPTSDRPSLPIVDLPSPNYGERTEAPVDMLILHYTGMKTAKDALDRLRDPRAKVSAHFVVDEDGTVFRLVPEDRTAWHAGVSHWRGHAALNARSLGIEIVNPGIEWGYRAFPALQMAAVCELSRAILARHPIPARNVVAHSDVAPDRKEDPGELFDWKGLAENGVGLWPADVPDLGVHGALRDAVAIRPVRAALQEIGYRVATEGGLDPTLSSVLRAFQRHWRPEAVTGQADDGTLVRLLAVQKLTQNGVNGKHEGSVHSFV